MIPVRILDNRSEAVALLTDKWREKPVTSGMLRAFVGPFDALESTTWDVLEKTRTLDGNIGGVWLDYLGRVVGEKRAGRVDASYTKAIKIRIRVNRSQGRVFDLIDVASLWGLPFSYTEFRFLSWQLDIPFDPFAPYLAILLTEAKAASSYGCVVSSSDPPEYSFSFSDGSDTTAGHVFASTV